MAIFKNKFLSKAGQKERIANVKNTLASALTGKGVQANTKSEKLNKVLSKAASNPFTTALVVAGAKNPTALKGAIKSGVGSLSGKTKAITGAGIIAGGSILISSPKARQTLSNPEQSLKQFGRNTGTLIENPTLQNAQALFKGNPILTSGAILGTGLIAGKGLTSAYTSLVNTRAVKENTEILKSNLPTNSLTPGDIIKSSEQKAPTPSELSPFETTSKTPNPRNKRRKSSKTKAKPQNINIRVYNNNQDGQYIRNKR